MNDPGSLPPRERQVMQILATRGSGVTASEIREAMPSAPSYSAVRALLKVMEEKGLLKHRQEGPRYVYESTTPQRKMRKSVLKEVLAGFFGGSKSALVETLFDPSEGKLSDKEIAQLEELIRQAGRKNQGD